MARKELQFRISSALKDIIGKDLINDDFIAVFELVKNSYDAHATSVEVIFENIYTENPKIIIKDNGKGMNYDDLINKWLFIAYSAKKEGTEEDSYKSYRNKIKVKRAYAGAKGIGRFSCDRLGQNLYLETKKDERKSNVEALITDWNLFEEDLKDEFINISVLHETIPESTYDIKHGTVLEITGLRNTWDRKKLLRLKGSLAKLINPNTHNQKDKFEITLSVNEEAENDKQEDDKVNGIIENLIFETLELKTTKVVSKVSKKEIRTELYEGGQLVYSLLEKNEFQSLWNINAEIYFMSYAAKQTFTRRMGMRAVDYGHIFIYKNGLRIYPYGERGEDPLKMDNRKAQGRTRYLGNREVLGYISIEEPNPHLQETSSRGDGLIKNSTYFELEQWFYQALRRVERYIIDVVDWGKQLSEDNYIQLDDLEKQDAISNLINSLTRPKNIISFEAPRIFELLEKKQEGSVRATLSNLTQKIESGDIDNTEVLKSISKVEKKIDSLQEAKDEAEDEALEKLIENENLAANIESQNKRLAFQGSILSSDKEQILSLQHQVHHSSSTIRTNIKRLLQELDIDLLSTEVKMRINVISLEASKINAIATYITKANFNLKATDITEDIVAFISNYVDEMYLLENRIINTNLVFEFKGKNIVYEREFRPLEITTLVDIFISNAQKANAKKVNFEFSKKKKQLGLKITDDGHGISKENLNNVFEMGFTTTDGSGIGLFQAYSIIVDNMEGEIEISSEATKGTSIEIIL